MKLTVYKKGDLCGAEVYLNGKRLAFDNDPNLPYGVRSAEAEVDGHVELRVIKMPMLLFKNWFLWLVLFWIGGLFGLISPHFRKKDMYVLDYGLKTDIYADETVELEVLNPKMPNTAVHAVYVRCNFPFYEENLGWMTDRKLKRRHRIYKAMCLLFWLLLVPAAITLTLLFA